MVSPEMDETGTGGDAFRRVMAILVIHPYPAGFQPVTWEKGDFSTFPPPGPPAERGEMNWIYISPSCRESLSQGPVVKRGSNTGHDSQVTTSNTESGSATSGGPSNKQNSSLSLQHQVWEWDLTPGPPEMGVRPLM